MTVHANVPEHVVAAALQSVLAQRMAINRLL